MLAPLRPAGPVLTIFSSCHALVSTSEHKKSQNQIAETDNNQRNREDRHLYIGSPAPRDQQNNADCNESEARDRHK